MGYVFYTIAGYFLGSVLFAYYLPLWLKGINVCELSVDGNPGTANVFKHGGIAIGILTLICELGKGFLPVFLSTKNLDVDNAWFILVLLAPVMGHAFPWKKGSHGGKSIAVSFGVLLGLFPNWKPVIILALSYLVFSLVIVVKPHFFRTIITFVCFNIGCFFNGVSKVIVVGGIALSIIVIIKHISRYRGEKLEMLLLNKKII